MRLTRLIYFSESLIDPGQGSVVAQLAEILSASNRNNESVDLTGALVFDDRWFLQALEGDRTNVWQTLKRIEEDERHTNVVIVEAKDVPARVFRNWWMGFAKHDSGTSGVFLPFLKDGRLDPRHMTSEAILDLMVRLSKAGLSRKLAVEADD